MITYFDSLSYKFNAKDKSILNRYIKPTLEAGGGAIGAIGSVGGAVYACGQTVGIGCYAATVAGSAGLTSSTDHLVTGIKNFGKPLSKQDPTQIVQTLKGLGLSNEAAQTLQFGIDVLGTGGLGFGVRPVTKAGKFTASHSTGASGRPNEVSAHSSPTTLKAKNSNASENKNIDFSRLCHGQVCFTAGTLIHTIRGLKPIEKIEHGELVWSREEFGNEYGYRPVISTRVTPNVPLYEIKVQHAGGLKETFRTTKEHPFWVDGQG